jgi:hypothetical protein
MKFVLFVYPAIFYAAFQFGVQANYRELSGKATKIPVSLEHPLRVEQDF